MRLEQKSSTPIVDAAPRKRRQADARKPARREALWEEEAGDVSRFPAFIHA